MGSPKEVNTTEDQLAVYLDNNTKKVNFIANELRKRTKIIKDMFSVVKNSILCVKEFDEMKVIAESTINILEKDIDNSKYNEKLLKNELYELQLKFNSLNDQYDNLQTCNKYSSNNSKLKKKTTRESLNETNFNGNSELERLSKQLRIELEKN